MEKRIIKFRGKRVDNGEWVYGDLFRSHPEHHSPSVSIATDEFHPVGYGSRTFYEVVPESVGQFVGLLDKSGKEVYEGDICHVETRFVGKIHVCVFDNVSCAFKWQLVDDVQAADNKRLKGELRSINRFSEINRPDELEVIGNVFEHPHLLTP